ncbi:MAG: DegT/DnrJ/EryC1/StrS family aminotransferase [Candidatus Paceibacterota bacterium]
MIVNRPVFSEEERKNILTELDKILESGWIGQGPKVKELEEKWCELTGAKYAVATNSCTSALDIAVRCAGFRNNYIPTVSAFTFISSALCLKNAGMEVRFVDIDERSFCTPKADIQVMYAGNQFGEGIIYDMAHSGGAKHKGLISCWSFHAVKNLPAGDGGMLTTNDEAIYKKARALSWCGIDKSTWERSGKKYGWDYSITEKGLKAHMNDITAVIALAKLKNLKRDNEYRAYLSDLYDEYLPKSILRPFKSETTHIYTVRVPQRDELFDFLAENDVNCGVHYKPLYYYDKVFGRNEKLPVTEKVFSEIISLPLHIGLTSRDIKKVCELIASFYAK